MKFTLLAASLRKDSVNKKLINETAKLLKSSGHETTTLDFSDLNCPLYDQDLMDREGQAAGAQKLIDAMKSSDALILSTPEYNYSIPGTLKNLIDWVSRDRPMPWDGQKILLLSASPSPVGGNRGYWATRIPLEGCGSFIYPKTLSLASAHDAFSEDGSFKESKEEERFKKLLQSFTSWMNG